MSRGLGKVQRMCLEVLAGQREEIDSIVIAAKALGKDEISDSEHVSFRRALRQLARAGKVVDMGRAYHNRRRYWALPEIAKRSFDLTERCLGREAAMQAKARAKFTAERFPEYA